MSESWKKHIAPDLESLAKEGGFDFLAPDEIEWITQGYNDTDRVKRVVNTLWELVIPYLKIGEMHGYKEIMLKFKMRSTDPENPVIFFSKFEQCMEHRVNLSQGNRANRTRREQAIAIEIESIERSARVAEKINLNK